MKVVKVWVTGRPNGQGYLASVAMDVEVQGNFRFQVRGLRLIETKEQKIVLAMPNIKDAKGKWQAVFSPLDQRTREVLESAAVAEWMRIWGNYRNPDIRELLEPL